MTANQQFIVALAAVIVGPLIGWLNGRKIAAVQVQAQVNHEETKTALVEQHSQLNGQQEKLIQAVTTAAKLQGMSDQREEDKIK